MNSLEEIYERLELAIERVSDIREEMNSLDDKVIPATVRDYFVCLSDFIGSCYDVLTVILSMRT